MISTRCIAVQEESQVGQVRRAVAEIADRLGADATKAGEAAIIATELAANLVRHAGGGQILLNEFPAAPEFSLELLSIDAGPGIADVGSALRDGFSTNGTAGNGLGAIRRLARRFELFTQPDRGTIVWVRVGMEPERASRFEIGGISTALENEPVCGDAWDHMEDQDGLRVVVADGLGHGAFAEEAAREALAVFRAHPKSSPAALMEFTHLALGKTRGAVGAIVEISRTKRELRSSGIGNIAIRVLSEGKYRSLISDNGTLGGRVRRAQEAWEPWAADAVLVMHSDGLSAQWSLEGYPGLITRHPAVMAAVLYRDFQRERDDTTVVVLKERR